MVKNRYYHDPSRKHIDVYSDFSQGLNSVNANDTLRDNELPRIKNYELGERGSLVQSGGYESYWTPATAGNPQGYFRYFKPNGTYDEVVVVGGLFYVNDVVTQVGTGASIQGTRQMEAVQYHDKLYIASGSGLLVYDGQTIDFVEPYTPKDLEALYVGTNGLMSDPNDYIQTTSGHSSLEVAGTQFAQRYGVQNEEISLDAFANKVNSGDVLEWRFQRRLPSHREDFWFTGQDWSTNSNYTFSTDWTGDVQFRVSVRKQGSSDVADTYDIPQYMIKPTLDPDDEIIDSDTIDSCNRILLHWDRLIMYGDPSKPDVIYISHLKNPGYFPVVNTLRFENQKREGLTALVRFRDNIVAFTETTIQGLYGKGTVGDDSFRRIMMNTGIGCIAPNSAKVIGNYIAFLSYEGIYYLKSLAYTESKTNVEPIDTRIHNRIPSLATDACAVVSDKQYRIVFPSSKRQLRYYYDWGVWSEDEYNILDFNRMEMYKGEVYAQRGIGSLVKDKPSNIASPSIVETKSFSFKEPHAPKKLKEVQLRVDVTEETTITMEVIIDEFVAITENVTLVPGQEMYNVPGFGKGLEMKVRITHNEAKPLQILGLGFIYKLKNP